MQEHTELLDAISKQSTEYSDANLALLKDLHARYEAALYDISRDNEALAKPYKADAYDAGKWINSALDPKASAKMKKAWFDMAVPHLKASAGALRTKLGDPESTIGVP